MNNLRKAKELKINKLTKEQKERIKKYELGRDIINNNNEFPENTCILYEFKREIKRTIKRIEDEIEFLHSQKFELDDDLPEYSLNLDRRDLLFQELKDYKLMEQLE